MLCCRPIRDGGFVDDVFRRVDYFVARFIAIFVAGDVQVYKNRQLGLDSDLSRSIGSDWAGSVIFFYLRIYIIPRRGKNLPDFGKSFPFRTYR